MLIQVLSMEAGEGGWGMFKSSAFKSMGNTIETYRERPARFLRDASSAAQTGWEDRVFREAGYNSVARKAGVQLLGHT